MISLTPQDVHEISATPKMPAGQYGETPDGRIWVYLQASVALAYGDAVEPDSYAAINADIDAVAAIDTVRVTATGDFTAAALVDMFSQSRPNGHTYFLWIDATATQGQGGIITSRISNNQVDVYFMTSDDGKLATALGITSDYIVFTLTRVKKSATVHATLTWGYVQRQAGVTDEYWFWALSKGVGVGLIDTSETAITAGAPVIVSADDGTLEGVDLTTPASQPYYGTGYGLFDQDADGPVLIVADCPRIAIPKVPAILTYAYPKV